MPPNYPNNNYQANAEPVPAQPVAPAPAPVKKSAGLIATVIVLLLAVIGLGVYIIIDSMKPAPTCPECPAITTSEVRILDFPFDSVAVLYDGEVYVNVNGSSDEFDLNFGDGTYQTLTSTRETYQEYDLGNTVIFNNANFSGAKLDASDVIYLGYNKFGHTPYDPKEGLLLVSDDGTVSYISILGLIRGETNPVILEGLTDVVSITSHNAYDDQGFGALATFAVTSDGTEIDLAPYIPAQQ